jgi:hypothetical protein
MKKIKLILIFASFTAFASCYRVKEYKYLNITFNDNNLNSFFLENYIDSVRNKNIVIPDSISYSFLFGNKIEENERLIHFKNSPEEWYMISFDATPCWIMSILNNKLNHYRIISDREELDDDQLKRIEKRFGDEILKPAEEYGKRHGLPDSILYNTKFK